MTNLTPEQRVLGRENADRALGHDPPRLAQGRGRHARPGGFYFGYKEMGNKPPSRPRSSVPATKAARP